MGVFIYKDNDLAADDGDDHIKFDNDVFYKLHYNKGGDDCAALCYDIDYDCYYNVDGVLQFNIWDVSSNDSDGNDDGNVLMFLMLTIVMLLMI